MDEVAAAKKMYEVVFPKLHAHQQVMLVPGTFACSNLTYFPIEQQVTNNVDKLQGYFDWVRTALSYDTLVLHAVSQALFATDITDPVAFICLFNSRFWPFRFIS